HRRIWRPVAVVTAMQSPIRTVDCDVHLHNAATSKVELLSPALMDRPVRAKPDVGRKLRRVRASDLRKPGRPRLFFAVTQELQVYRGPLARGADCIERGEDRYDRRFVIRSRTCVDPPLGVDTTSGNGRLRNRSPGFKYSRPQHRLERIRSPF